MPGGVDSGNDPRRGVYIEPEHRMKMLHAIGQITHREDIAPEQIRLIHYDPDRPLASFEIGRAHV